jgi:osmotically-inducible protein OsmY
LHGRLLQSDQFPTKEDVVPRSDNSRNRTDDREISDQAIAEEAQRRLRASGYVSLRSVKCKCRNNIVTLSGRLPSFYLKQLAQTEVLAVPFVAALVNNIDVLG